MARHGSQPRQSRRATKKGSRHAGALVAGPMTASSSMTVVPKLQSSQKVTTFSVWDPSPHGVATSISVSTSAGFNFQISNLGSPTMTLVQEFEAYRIVRVDAVYIPNSFIGSLVAPASGAVFWTAFDPDDNTSLVSVAQLAGKQRSTVHSLFEKFELSFQPRPSQALFSNALFSGYSIASAAPWVDSSNLSVPHFGMKWSANAVDISNAGGVFLFRYTIDVMMVGGV